LPFFVKKGENIMKLKGQTLILSGIAGIILLLLYKVINHTLPYFGPKSLPALVLFVVLIAVGIKTSLKKKEQKA